MNKPMTARERQKYYFQNTWWLPKDVPMCANCEHFRRHYVKLAEPNVWRTAWAPLDCGHCVYPRLKNRKTYDTCEHFEQKFEGVQHTNKNAPVSATNTHQGLQTYHT